MNLVDYKILSKPIKMRDGELINKNHNDKVLRNKIKELRSSLPIKIELCLSKLKKVSIWTNNSMIH